MYCNSTFGQRVRAIVFFLLLSLTATHAHAGVIYVDDDASPGGDGTSWNSAYQFLHDALAFANVPANHVTEIRIAQGTYKPDHSALHPEGTGDVNATFEFKQTLSLGGFAGVGAIDPDSRDINVFPTILSGDLLDNDQPDFVNYEDNSRYVVYWTSNLDGCTIRSGRTGAYGDTKLSNCQLIQNLTAVNVDEESCEAYGCIFDSNQSGIYNDWGFHIHVEDCQFSNHSHSVITLIEAGGSGAYHCTFTNNRGGIGRGYEGDGLYFFDCDFTDNTAQFGAVLYVQPDTSGSYGSFVNCRFKHNSAERGGAIYAKGKGNISSGFTCTNCVFFDNTASQAGGAIYSYHSGGKIVNCTFAKNSAPDVGAIFNSNQSSLTVYNSILWNNPGGDFGGQGKRSVHYTDVAGGHAGISNRNVDPKFININSGDLRLKPISKCIDAGRKLLLPQSVVTDCAGDPRFVNVPGVSNGAVGGPPVDLGAFEFQRN